MTDLVAAMTKIVKDWSLEKLEKSLKSATEDDAIQVLKNEIKNREKKNETINN